MPPVMKAQSGLPGKLRGDILKMRRVTDTCRLLRWMEKREKKDETSHLDSLWGLTLLTGDQVFPSGKTGTQPPSWGSQVDRQSATKPTVQVPPKGCPGTFFLPFLKILDFDSSCYFPMKDNIHSRFQRPRTCTQNRKRQNEAIR